MLVSAQCLVVETEHRLHIEMLCEVICVCWSWGALCLCQWCWCSWFLKTRPGDSRPLSGTCTNPSSTRYYCCSSHYWLGQTCSLSCECLSPSCVCLCVCMCRLKGKRLVWSWSNGLSFMSEPRRPLQWWPQGREHFTATSSSKREFFHQRTSPYLTAQTI